MPSASAGSPRSPERRVPPAAGHPAEGDGREGGARRAVHREADRAGRAAPRVLTGAPSVRQPCGDSRPACQPLGLHGPRTPPGPYRGRSGRRARPADFGLGAPGGGQGLPTAGCGLRAAGCGLRGGVPTRADAGAACPHRGRTAVAGWRYPTRASGGAPRRHVDHGRCGPDRSRSRPLPVLAAAGLGRCRSWPLPVLAAAGPGCGSVLRDRAVGGSPYAKCADTAGGARTWLGAWQRKGRRRALRPYWRTSVPAYRRRDVTGVGRVSRQVRAVGQARAVPWPRRHRTCPSRPRRSSARGRPCASGTARHSAARPSRRSARPVRRRGAAAGRAGDVRHGGEPMSGTARYTFGGSVCAGARKPCDEEGTMDAAEAGRQHLDEVSVGNARQTLLQLLARAGSTPVTRKS